MKLINSPLILTMFLFVVLISCSEVDATGDQSCIKLLHPLETKVEEIKGRGGIWGLFDQNYQVAHSKVTIQLDSKIMVLVSRLNHLCATKNGVPLDEIAQILVPQIKASGKKVVMENLINFGHVAEEAEKLIAYAKFAKSNVNRKLEFELITKAIKDSQIFVNRLVELSQKIGEVGSEKVLAESKVLISIIEKFLATDPYLVLAGKENSEIPHALFLTGNSDDM